ncbi:MAG: APC family permease [Mycobacterium leprae]
MPREPFHVVTRRVKRIVYGRPKRTDQAHHERLGVITGLAVFSADALSSVAYATEEILLVLAAAGAAASVFALPVGLAIVLLVFIVAASYSQTIHAYPGGGGSYIVSKDNLGTFPGLVAGAALLVDYVLTVAVSTASGIAAITSAVPWLRGHVVLLCLAAIWFIAWVNLRGVKESGTVFAIPTYGFIVSMFLLIAVGGVQALTGGWHPIAPVRAGFGLGDPRFQAATQGITLFMLLRAFASGCTALSGIEAVSNGVQAFQAPEADTAIRTMNLGRTILYTMFAGITLLAYGFGLMPREGDTLLSQIARHVFGSGPLYLLVQAFTALILLLAANTAYADFPRLAGLIGRDSYLPRKLANRGDTLVLNGGVYLLAFLATVLVVAFRGNVHHLIPLYAVGVFLAFTMSQTGMVVHWVNAVRRRKGGWRGYSWAIFINSLGAVLSGIALVVITIAKFVQGAWIVTIVVPLLIGYFLYVHDYYQRFKERLMALRHEHLLLDSPRQVKIVVTIGDMTPVVHHVMNLARHIARDITAVYIAADPEAGENLARLWNPEEHGGVKLAVVESPYRTIVPPLRKFLQRMHQENPDSVINLLVPSVVTNDPFDAYLHNGTANQMLRELRFSEGILVTVVPFYVNMDPEAPRAIATYQDVAEPDGEESFPVD